MFKAMGKYVRAVFYLVTFRIDKASETLRMNPGVMSATYDRIIVVYGDCGTAGLLDDVLSAEGVIRGGGPVQARPDKGSAPGTQGYAL